MGVKVGRIVKEFVFKSLTEQQIPLELHGNRKELSCTLSGASENTLELSLLKGIPEAFKEGEAVRVFFYFQNNYHTFETTILKIAEGRLHLQHPELIYKNPQRKYERIKITEPAEVYFILKGQKVELNFPKSGRFFIVEEPPDPEKYNFANMRALLRQFREKMAEAVSDHRITMLRNRLPKAYEEKIVIVTGKLLWIPSAEEDFPYKDPFPDERILTKRELVKYEESFGTPAYVIASKLGNLLYEKQKKRIYSELFCPILYNEYIIGLIHLVNRDEKREKISTELVDYVYQFSKVLSYSLKQSGYFSAETSGERRYEAPIIDLSPAGVLFAHSQEDLGKELLINTDLDTVIRFSGRKMTIGSRVRRKFKDNERHYFGVQFLRLEPEDLSFLFEKLYGRPYNPAEDDFKWEGGVPPPKLDLFDQEGPSAGLPPPGGGLPPAGLPPPGDLPPSGDLSPPGDLAGQE